MTTIDATDPTVNQIDVLVGGTPCQAFSVAGLRKSLEDERGNFSLAFCRLSRRIAAAGRLRTVVWENVPGVLSTKDNAFGCFLAGIVGESVPLVPSLGTGGSWPNAGCVYGPEGSLAWRVLDAQYFGLAQRRKRVFVVFCVGSWADPAKILFEWEGVRRDSPPSREAGERVAGTIAAGAHPRGFNGRDAERGNVVASTLPASDGGPSNGYQPVVAMCLNGGVGGMNRINAESETFVVGTLTGNGDAHSRFRDERGLTVTHPLKAEGHDASEDGTGRGVPLVPVVFAIQERAGAEKNNQGPQGKGYQEGVAYTLESRHHVQSVAQPNAVRRLLPVECERLMGFPDDYTNILGAADGPRYKALGNSMAVPCMNWIGRRIVAAMTTEKNQ